jgi:PHD/YefM family antitoxin component YafN of YafNO toxin-antitoxin module
MTINVRSLSKEVLMLYPVMPTLPVSDLRNKQAEVVKQLDKTPILLTRGGHSAGVLVHPEQWNQLMAQLARLQRHIRADQLLAEMKAGNYLTQEQFDAELAGG